MRGMEGAPLTILIVRPPSDLAQDGNKTTADRWARLLTELGHEARVTEGWDGTPCDLLVALHARKSHDAVVRSHKAAPDRPILVCGAGTDLYSDVEPGEGDEVLESLRVASRILLLQELARERVPEELRDRARVLHQSALPMEDRPAPPEDHFRVAFLANVRPVKDPLTALRAAERLPEGIRIVHAGAHIDPDLSQRLARRAADCRAFESRGPLSPEEARALIASSHLLLSTSRHEGGANVLSEALALEVPILCTNIPGSLGLLGSGYPGTFEVEDAKGLAAQIVRARDDEAFGSELRAACAERAWLANPKTEREGWRRLLAELTT